jgi:hypothetical protein
MLKEALVRCLSRKASCLDLLQEGLQFRAVHLRGAVSVDFTSSRALTCPFVSCDGIISI